MGKKVIIAGRTESELETTVKEIGSKKLSYYVLDTGEASAIPSFISKIIKEHPDLDCLVNNAGVQRPFQITSMDLAKADQEIDINVRGPMHLTVGLLPHLQGKKGALIANVSSVLGYVPTSVQNPVYNGTKAWMHSWSMNLRTQLKAAGKGSKNIRVVEVVPPSVGTDLHREREDPDDNKKDKNPSALSVEEFMEDFKDGMEEGEDVVAAGMGKKLVSRWYGEFGRDYKKVEKKEGDKKKMEKKKKKKEMKEKGDKKKNEKKKKEKGKKEEENRTEEQKPEEERPDEKRPEEKK